jgi:hypothetical protein
LAKWLRDFWHEQLMRPIRSWKYRMTCVSVLGIEMASTSPSAPELDDVRAVVLRAEDHDAVLAGDGHRPQSSSASRFTPDTSFQKLTRLKCGCKLVIAMVCRAQEWLGVTVMAGERRIYSIEECYRLAAEARRMAEKPGVSPAEKADLLEVEAQWLSLARSRPNGVQ